MAHPYNEPTEYDIGQLDGFLDGVATRREIRTEPIYPEPTTAWCAANAALHKAKDAAIRRLNSELLIACIIAATGWIAAVAMWWRS